MGLKTRLIGAARCAHGEFLVIDPAAGCCEFCRSPPKRGDMCCWNSKESTEDVRGRGAAA